MPSEKTSTREWRRGGDGVWASDDGVRIEGSPGHFFASGGDSALVEGKTPQEAMSIADENWPYKDAAATAGGSPPDDAKTWTPEWVLCENGQCDFGIDVTTIVILQRCRTEDGNWLYMAVSTSTRESEGGVALAIEQKGVQP